MSKKHAKKKTTKELKQIRKKSPLTCGKCRLWNSKEGICTVVIVDKGEKFELQTKAQDPCMWDAMGVEVHRIRAFSDGKDGFVEYTEGTEDPHFPDYKRGIDPIKGTQSDGVG
jgi:hypothetical protein